MDSWVHADLDRWSGWLCYRLRQRHVGDVHDRVIRTGPKMRLIAPLLVALLLPGCAVLSAMGLGVKDLAPSLSHCERVKYDRKGLDIKIEATCRVPAG